MFIIVENAPLSLASYKRVFSSIYIWNDFLNSPSADQGIFNFRGYIYLLGRLTSLNLAQLILIIKLFLVAAAYKGLLLNGNYINRRYFKETIPKLAIYIGALVYVTNPSFLIGDNFWLGIQVGYYTLPLILYAASQIIVGDKRIQNAIILFFLFSLNNAIHFVFGGYQIIIGGYVALILILEKELINAKAKLFGALLLIAACFVTAEASNLLGTFMTVSSIPTSMTKESIDVPWSTATFLNMTHGMSYTEIFNDFFSTKNQLFDALISLALTIVPGAIVWLFAQSYQPLNSKTSNSLRQVTLIGIIIYILILFIFAADSPAHFLQYFVTFDFPLGRVFRTWRVPETILALISSGLFTVVLMKAFAKSSSPNHNQKNRVIVVTAIAMASIIVSVYPVAFNKINGPIIKTPIEYEQVNKFLGAIQDQSHAVLFSPALTASYGIAAALKPYWSPDMGMIMEFIAYSPPMRSIVPQNNPKNFYLYTSSEFYKKTSLLLNSNFYALSHFYALDNVSYLVLHTDMPTALTENHILDGIKNSAFWETLKSFGNLNVYKNKIVSSDIRAADNQNIILVNGGYRVVARLFNELPQTTSSNTEFLFIDQGIQFSQMKKIKYLLTDKPPVQNVYDYIYSKILESPQENISKPALATNDYSPDKSWSTATLASNHQQEWQPFINRMNDYAWDFDENLGYLMTNHTGSRITIKQSPPKSSKNIVLIRYLANDAGGVLKFKFGTDEFLVNSKSNYNGMVWIEHQIDSKPDTYDITNVSGFNAVSTVVTIDAAQYGQMKNESANALKDVKVIDAHIPYEKNLVPAGSLATRSDLAHWTPIKGTKNMTLTLGQNIDTGAPPSLIVEKNDTLHEWSWIASDWIPVQANRNYQFTAHMKTVNAQNSHIVFLGQDQTTGREEELAQVPYATSGTTAWQTYQQTIKIPSQFSRVRVILNAGWEQDQQIGNARTEFSEIQLTPLDEARNDFDLNHKNTLLKLVNRINPTHKELTLRPDAGPVFIATTDSFDNGWRAFVARTTARQNFWQWITMQLPGKEISKQAHLQANGFNNGWLITGEDHNEALAKSEYKVILEYWPQRYFAIGLMITGTGLAASALYLIYTFVQRRRKSFRQRIRRPLAIKHK